MTIHAVVPPTVDDVRRMGDIRVIGFEYREHLFHGVRYTCKQSICIVGLFNRTAISIDVAIIEDAQRISHTFRRLLDVISLLGFLNILPMFVME